MLQKLVDKVVERKVRELITPEKVEEVINDVFDLLNAGLGHVGLDARVLSYVEDQLDKAELSAAVASRLLHLLIGQNA
jgi:hypothetical protein